MGILDFFKGGKEKVDIQIEGDASELKTWAQELGVDLGEDFFEAFERVQSKVNEIHEEQARLDAELQETCRRLLAEVVPYIRSEYNVDLEPIAEFLKPSYAVELIERLADANGWEIAKYKQKYYSVFQEISRREQELQEELRKATVVMDKIFQKTQT